ncbi:hypothetical protein MVEN_00039900 [Mycena venus]|uniref:Uncharacterized protein n=1 Tax=Mycena venus TaxID=2733690 RepID=A0A8H7DHR3_9AGAR|nr:hypothetical protein MVEN_00039900 [Mycena venus]
MWVAVGTNLLPGTFTVPTANIPPPAGLNSVPPGTFTVPTANILLPAGVNSAPPDINHGRCKIPDANGLLHLDEEGHVQEIILSADDTPHDIQAKFMVAFSHIPAIVEHGFRLFCTEKVMVRDRGKPVPKKGTARLLRPLWHTEFDRICIKRAMTDSNVRLSGPRFRHLIFFALLRAGPNLPLRGVVHNSAYDDLDRDLGSEEMEDSEEEDSATDTTSDTMSDGDGDDDENENDGGRTDSFELVFSRLNLDFSWQ